MSIEVHLSPTSRGEQTPDTVIGEVYRYPHAGGERIGFRYDPRWLMHEERFAIDPDLYLDSRTTSPKRGGVFGAFADCAPDRWGRQLMQRAERRNADEEGRQLRTLSAMDYVLGVSDASRLGALRFYCDDEFQSPGNEVPPLIRLASLLDAANRLDRGEESDADFALIFAPGSSLGGARPKASILDAHGNLSIAKFPREGDEYSIERWESIALTLAHRAGIKTAASQLIEVSGKQVLLSRRFDRRDGGRVHFASAMTLLGLQDGDHASYPELAEILQRDGASPRRDSEELYRRLVFNISIANVDDHLRNHGFLRETTRSRSSNGWALSPAYDLNPVPMDLKPRILSTNVTLDDATGSLDAAREVASFFGLSNQEAARVIDEVSAAVAQWPSVARSAGASAPERARMESAFLFTS